MVKEGANVTGGRDSSGVMAADVVFHSPDDSPARANSAEFKEVADAHEVIEPAAFGNKLERIVVLDFKA